MSDHLLARLTEATEHLAWLTAAVHSPKGKRPTRPHPIPRPGDHARERVKPSQHDWKSKVLRAGGSRYVRR